MHRRLEVGIKIIIIKLVVSQYVVLQKGNADGLVRSVLDFPLSGVDQLESVLTSTAFHETA